MNPWPNQISAIDDTVSAIQGGAKRICVTSPTGTGKTKMMIDLIEWANRSGLGTVLYTNRRMLLEQTYKVLESHGIDVGVRASGYEPATLRPVQLAMVQTESSRVLKMDAREVHNAKLAIVDELHNQGGDQMKALLERHYREGAAMVGYTATPLDIGDLVDELIVAGNVSEGRECGALVPAVMYGPDEPDLRLIKKYRVGEDLSEAENSKAIMRPGVFSRVFDNYERLNPDRLPAILFAPDVAGSIWFTQQFHQRGIRAAHIDGDKIWLDGEFHDSTSALREEISRLSKSGYLPVVCNRFVLREGVDWPWLRFGILATVFGSLTSYLQSCGRLLRKCDGKDSVIIQDHGGNWWRHGSVNADREWSLGDTCYQVATNRIEALRSKKEPEPIHCPYCHAIRLSGSVCHKCGHASNSRSRLVVQVAGQLKEYRGDIVKPRKVSLKPDTERIWEAMYFRMKRANRTFRQAEGLFFHENHYWPPRTLPLMPVNDGDWSRKVGDVPRDLLRQRKFDAAEPVQVGP